MYWAKLCVNNEQQKPILAFKKMKLKFREIPPGTWGNLKNANLNKPYLCFPLPVVELGTF